ncbi:MAG TPA: DUF6114 domain-containing protein [Candidatus Limnocylindrales bacterium]|nr:DUF6114 domain-containing protein [Candidatus Limnocylindrales bacterium]
MASSEAIHSVEEPDSAATAESGAPNGSAATRAAEPARVGWRRSRPFWAGLIVTLAGLEILLTMMAPLPVIIHLGVQGLAGYLVPVIIVLCGQLMWWNPSQRLFYSIMALIMSLAAWVTSNLGGFILGIILGLVGGSLAFAWNDPHSPKHRG